MELLNFIGENIAWFLCLVVTLSWVIKEAVFSTVQRVVETPSAEIERPQLTVRIDVYKGNIAKIIATDAENRLMPDILQSEGQEKALNLVGYAKVMQLPFEAVREATTTLEPVCVEVEQGLDAVYPKTVEEAIEGLKPKGKKE